MREMTWSQGFFLIFAPTFHVILMPKRALKSALRADFSHRFKKTFEGIKIGPSARFFATSNARKKH